ncbi:hypothetical protein DVH05_015740 [Phytophthora capsici]|nr:hypothetical protein DVH05_015740 [Phytophthora capsici]
MLAHHYHPSVQRFTRQLLDNKDSGIQYAGDPLVDFTMYAFFEKFVNKKPRQRLLKLVVTTVPRPRTGRSRLSTVRLYCKRTRPTWTLATSSSTSASRSVLRVTLSTRIVVAQRPRDAFSDMEDDADDDEIGAYAQEPAEGIMEDNNHDGENPDMADWNDVEANAGE